MSLESQIHELVRDIAAKQHKLDDLLRQKEQAQRELEEAEHLIKDAKKKLGQPASGGLFG